MDLLQEVKNRLLITGNFHDTMFLDYIEDVKNYMLGAGVKKTIVESEQAVGCICKGVSDLWINGTFSELFKQRLIQLSLEVEDVQSETTV